MSYTHKYLNDYSSQHSIRTDTWLLNKVKNNPVDSFLCTANVDGTPIIGVICFFFVFFFVLVLKRVCLYKGETLLGR